MYEALFAMSIVLVAQFYAIVILVERLSKFKEVLSVVLDSYLAIRKAK